MSKVLDYTKALVLFSGGQDSTVCVRWALEQYKHVYTIGFRYGQRHHAELDCRTRILKTLSLSGIWKNKLMHDIVLDMGFFTQLGNSALLSQEHIKAGQDGLPNTFVPGRNLLFLTAAAAHAYSNGIGTIVAGMSEEDFSGYPDCRAHTITALGEALDLGMDTRFELQTPLMHSDKSKVWERASSLGGREFFELVRTETHTCYKNDRSNLHDWGYGCGECPACILRKRGYAKYVTLHAN